MVRWLPAEPPLRFGIVTSKKVGKAVVRNRIRRRLRELLRRQSLPPCELLVVVFPEAAGASFQELAQDLQLALERSGLLPSHR
jgi:ribonuclease P protein component